MKINLVRIAIVFILLLSCTNKKFINRYNLAFLVNQTKDQEEKEAARFDAIARDSQEEVQDILRNNAAAEVQALLGSHNTENRTPLQEAIQCKNKAIIQHLVDAGATLAVQPGNLTTPQQGNDAPIAILQELLEKARQEEDLPFLLCLAKSKGELNVAKTLEELATNSESREEVLLQVLEGARHKNEVRIIDRILVNLEKEILVKVLLRAVEKDYHQLIPFLLTPENQEKLGNASLEEIFEYAANTQQQELFNALYKSLSSDKRDHFFKKAVEETNSAFVNSLLAQREEMLGEDELKKLFQYACQQDKGDIVQHCLRSKHEQLKAMIPSSFLQACRQGCTTVVQALCPQLDNDTIATGFEQAIDHRQAAVIGCLPDNQPSTTLLVAKLDSAVKKNKYGTITAILQCLGKEKLVDTLLKAIEQNKPNLLPSLLEALNKKNIGNREVETITQFFINAVAQGNTSHVRLVLEKVQAQLTEQAIAQALLRTTHQEVTSLLYEQLSPLDLRKIFVQAVADNNRALVGCLLEKAPDALPDDTLSKALENALKAKIAPVITTIVTQISQSVLQKLWQQWIEEEQHCQIVKSLLSYPEARVKIGQKTIDAAFTNACKQGEHHALLQVLLNLNQVQQEGIVAGLVTTSMGGHVQSTAHILKNIAPAMFGNVLVAAAEQDQAAIIRLLLTQQYQPLQDCTIANALQQAIELDTNKVFNTLVNHLSKDVLCRIFVKAVKDSKVTFVKFFITHVEKGVVNEVWQYGIGKKEASVIEALLAYERSRTIIGSQAIQQTTEEVTAQEKHPLLGVLLNKAKLGNECIIKMFNTAMDQGKLDKLTNILKEIDEKNLIEVFYYALEKKEKIFLPFLINKAKASNAGKEAIVEALKNAVNQGNEASVKLLLRQAEDMLKDTTLATALLQAPDAPNRKSLNQMLCAFLSPFVLGEIFENAVKEDNATLVNRILDGGSDKLDKAKLQQTFKDVCQQSRCIVALFLKKEAVKAILQAVIPYCFEQAYQKNQAAVAGCLLANTQDFMPEDVLKKAIVQTVENKQEEIRAVIFEKLSNKSLKKVLQNEIERIGEKDDVVKALLAHSTAKLKLGQATINNAFINTCTKKQGAALLPVFLDPKNVENNVIAEGLAVAINKGYFTSVDTILDNLEKETLAYVLSEAAKQEQELLLSLILSRVKEANIHDKAILDAFQRTVVHNNGNFVAMFLKNVSEKLDHQEIKNAWKKALGHGSASVVTSLLEDKNAVDQLQTIPLKELIEAMLTPQSGYTALQLMALWEKLVEHGILEGKGESSSSLTSLPHAMVAHGCQEGVKKLFEEETIIDVNAKNSQGRTPLDLALEQNKDKDVLKSLLYTRARTIQNFKRPTIQNFINELLWSAVKTGDPELVELLIDNGADMSLEDERGCSLSCVVSEQGNRKILEILGKARLLEKYNKAGETPLIQSIKLGSEVAERLLKAGANVHTPLRDKDGWTPLHVAAENGHLAVVRLLLEWRAEVNKKNEDGWTPLHVAAKEGHLVVLCLLLEWRAEVNEKDKDGWTPLHVAAKEGRKAVVEFLLAQGALSNVQSKCGETPLDLATKHRHEGLAKVLQAKQDTWEALLAKQDTWKVPLAKILRVETVVDKRGDTFLHWAAYGGNKELIVYLVEQGVEMEVENSYGRTPLHEAAKSGHEKIAEFLVEKGANGDVQDNYGNTPLHLAAHNGHEKVVKMLVEKGANVKIRNKYDSTPLHLAAHNGHEKVAALLLTNNAEIEAKDKCGGSTALHWAAYNGHEAVVKMLVEKGANVKIRNKYDSTPLHLAAHNGHEKVAALLLTNNAEIEAKDKCGGSTALHWAAYNGHEAVVKMLVEKGANVKIQNEYGRTPLYDAARKGHTKVVALLLENGANGKIQDKYGRTPLHDAAENGHKEVAQVLVKSGVNVKIQNNFSRTPLHDAAENGHKEVAEYLIEQGAQVDAQDPNLRTPLHLAASKGHPEVVKLLLDKKDLPLNVKDRHGRTPLDKKDLPLNVKDRHGRTPLDKKDLPLNVKDRHGRTPLDKKDLPLNVKDRHGRTPLDKKDLPLNVKDRHGRTPLHLAAGNGHTAVAKVLVEKEASVDVTDRHGRTPLHWAAQNGHTAIAEVLVEKGGASMHTKDNRSLTPLNLAAEKGYQGVVDLLVELVEKKAPLSVKGKNSPLTRGS